MGVTLANVLRYSGRLGGAHVAFSGVAGGFSAPPYGQGGLNLGDQVGDEAGRVEENRQRFAQALGALVGAGAIPLLAMRQTHSDLVTTCDRQSLRQLLGAPATTDAEAGAADSLQSGKSGVWLEVGECDALIWRGGPPPAGPVTDTTPSATNPAVTVGVAGGAVGIVVQVADCLPLALAHREAPVGAVVHAGRRGVQANIVARCVEALRQDGYDPADFQAFIGPHICGPCYPVGEELAGQITEQWPAASARSRDGQAAVDLAAAVAQQLHAEGITQVTHSGICTRENEDFYSYRRHTQTGRQALALVFA